MSAGSIRTATALMRRRAKNATPGPWRAKGDKAYATGRDHRLGFKKTGAAPDIDHLASWHPDVALAVADLLDLWAELDDKYEFPEDTEHLLRPVLAVVRAYLGDTDERSQEEGR